MSSLTICPDCGTEIPADAPAGVCPKCLLQAGMLNAPASAADQPTVATNVETAQDTQTVLYSSGNRAITTHIQDNAARTRHFGDYELLQEIARGGMGVVYKARQVRLNRTVALKMILSGQFAGEADVRRFQAEAEAAAQLDHPGIVPIFEVGECEGCRFFSMAFISGDSLAERLVEGPLPPREAAKLLRATAEAVQYAHDHGVIHRDLKPGNILLDSEGHPRVTDFGLAKQVKRESGLTATGQVLGTPGFMPPEQASGQSHDARAVSDVYALGAVLYAALTGRPPFHADNPVETMMQVLEREPVSPRQLNPAVPQDLETICLKCLEKDERKRYSSAAEFGDELQRFLEGRAIVARPISVASRAARWCRRNPAIAFLTGFAAASLIVGSTLALYYAIEARGKASLALDEKRRADIAAGEAEQARDQANEKLWGSYLAQARAVRWSRRQGQRFSGLDSLQKASDLLPSLQLDEAVAAQRQLQLRNEAVACLSLPDLRVGWERKISAPWTRFTAFDPKFERYAQGDKLGNVRVGSVPDDRELFRLPKQRGQVAGVVFDRSGRWLAVKHRYRVNPGREENVVCVWDLPSRRKLLSVPISHSGFAFCFHPRENTFAVGGQSGLVQIYDLKTGRSLRTLRSFFHPVRIDFSADGRMLAVCTSAGMALALDLDVSKNKAGILRRRGVRLSGGIADVAWHPGERILAVASKDRSIRIWDLRKSPRLLTKLEGHEGPVVGVCFHPSGNLLASQAWDGSTRLWNVAAGRELLRAEGQCVAFSPDGRRLHFLRGRFGFGYWDCAGGEEFRPFIAPPSGGKVLSTDVRAGGRVLLVARLSGVYFHRLPDGRALGSIAIGQTMGARFGPNGDVLYTSGTIGVFRWPVSTSADGTVLKIGPPVRIAPTGGRMSLTADGRKLAVDVDFRQALLIDVNDPSRSVRFGDHPHLEYVAVSPDGRWVATGTWQGYGIKVWDGETGQLLTTLLPKAYTARPEFSPDGKWLITTTGQDYQFWETGTWARKLRLERDGGSNVPGVVAFSRRGDLLAVASSRKNVQLVEASTGRLVAKLQTVVESNVEAMCLSPSGTQLIIARERLECWDLGLIRRRLASMSLDWPGDPLSARTATSPARLLNRIEVDSGGLKIAPPPQVNNRPENDE